MKKILIKGNGLKGEIGDKFFPSVFGGYSFPHCIKELVKNSRDWFATTINLTTSDLAYLTIVDNGIGMNEERCHAAVSVNKSPAEITQMGKFGTGLKHVLYSIGKRMQIRSAPKVSRNHV